MPSKRYISLPERHAATVEAIAHRVTQAWPVVLQVSAAQAPPTLRAAGSRDGGRSSDHPDPTSAIAFGHPDFDELCDAIYAWMEQGRWIEVRVNNLLRQHPELARAADAELLRLRCADPVCTNNAVRSGLCRRHWDEHRLNRPQPDARTSTPNVVEPGSFATVTCMTCGSDYPVPAGTDPATWLKQHKATCEGTAVTA